MSATRFDRQRNRQYYYRSVTEQALSDRFIFDENSVDILLRIEDFEHRIKRPRTLVAEGESEINQEQYPEVLKMWMKRTVFENVREISNFINRRPQYVMKFLTHELGKTCFYNMQTDSGVILHNPIPSYMQLLTKQTRPEQYVPTPEPPCKHSVNLDDIEATKKIIRELLKNYVAAYVKCPSCNSTNTINPIADAQQDEEENMSFAISCKDCNETHEMNVDDDPFLMAISASRTRNNINSTNGTGQHYARGANRRDRYMNGYQTYYHNGAQYYAYPYPAYYNGAYYASYGYYPYAQQYYYDQSAQSGDATAQSQYYLQQAIPYGYNYMPQPYGEEGNEQVYTDDHFADGFENGQTNNVAVHENSNSPRDAPEEPQIKSAGLLPFCRDDTTGRILFLLGKDVRGSNPNRPISDAAATRDRSVKSRSTWSEFGGKKSKLDIDAAATAAREFSYETHGAFSEGDQPSLLESIEIMERMLRKEDVRKVYNKNGKYQLYLVQVPHIKREKILDARKHSDKIDQTEKVDFEWVDGESLFNLICGDSSVKHKMVSSESGLLQWRENEELHPFFLTLFKGAKTLIKPLLATPQKLIPAKPVAKNNTNNNNTTKSNRKKLR
jgi:translation initiation factor 2 beta subunit (eIF-2beta)/eIF-5